MLHQPGRPGEVALLSEPRAVESSWPSRRWANRLHVCSSLFWLTSTQRPRVASRSLKTNAALIDDRPAVRGARACAWRGAPPAIPVKLGAIGSCIQCNSAREPHRGPSPSPASSITPPCWRGRHARRARRGKSGPVARESNSHATTRTPPSRAALRQGSSSSSCPCSGPSVSPAAS